MKYGSMLSSRQTVLDCSLLLSSSFSDSFQTHQIEMSNTESQIEKIQLQGWVLARRPVSLLQKKCKHRFGCYREGTLSSTVLSSPPSETFQAQLTQYSMKVLPHFNLSGDCLFEYVFDFGTHFSFK